MWLVNLSGEVKPSDKELLSNDYCPQCVFKKNVSLLNVSYTAELSNS